MRNYVYFFFINSLIMPLNCLYDILINAIKTILVGGLGLIQWSVCGHSHFAVRSKKERVRQQRLRPAGGDVGEEMHVETSGRPTAATPHLSGETAAAAAAAAARYSSPVRG